MTSFGRLVAADHEVQNMNAANHRMRSGELTLPSGMEYSSWPFMKMSE